MSDQQESLKTFELILFEIITPSANEINELQTGQAYVRPTIQSGNFKLNLVIPADTETVEDRSTIRDLWLATPLFYKQLIEGAAAVILGTLIGLVIPWLTAGF